MTVLCRTGDDVESGQELFHRLACFVLALGLGQHSYFSGEKNDWLLIFNSQSTTEGHIRVTDIIK